MFELPLFPLNTVLFPGMPLQLHIFEDRYKLMINSCIEKRQPFGVVLIKHGREANGMLAEPHQVGCTAQVTQVQPVGHDRMNIVAIGQERFRIISLSHDKPYLVGMVELYPFDQEDTAGILLGIQRLRPLVENYLTLLDKAGQIRQIDVRQMPKDPLALAYLASVLLRLPSTQQKVLLALLLSDDHANGQPLDKLHDYTLQQQSLLESERTTQLLASLRLIYRRETALLKAMLTPPPQDEKPGPFSLS